MYMYIYIDIYRYIYLYNHTLLDTIFFFSESRVVCILGHMCQRIISHGSYMYICRYCIWILWIYTLIVSHGSCVWYKESCIIWPMTHSMYIYTYLCIYIHIMSHGSHASCISAHHHSRDAFPKYNIYIWLLHTWKLHVCPLIMSHGSMYIYIYNESWVYVYIYI